MTGSELATVLAALRMFQSATNESHRHECGEFDDDAPLNNEQIDELCERLNVTPTVPMHSKDTGNINELADEALDCAARYIQEALGVESGDVAGVVFSDGETQLKLRYYVCCELLDQERKDAQENPR